MPRKRNELKEQQDNYNKAFPSVLRELMKDRKTTQAELASYLSKTRQSITYYCDGSSSPDWETLVKIATFFNVSADYLLGLSGEPSKEPCAVDKLGLSPKAVNQIMSLHNYDEDRGLLSGLNILLESTNLFFIAQGIKQYQDAVAIERKYVETIFPKEMQKVTGSPIPPEDALQMQEFLTATQLEKELMQLHPEFFGRISVICGDNYLSNKLEEIKNAFEAAINKGTGFYDYQSYKLDMGE